VSTLYTREKNTKKKEEEKLTQSPEMLQVWLTSESKLACLTL
jgi:hypothetical protein